MVTWFQLLTSAAMFLVGMGAAVACVRFGYWMGRNSSDQPYRNDFNPPPSEAKGYAPVEDEVPGDVFDEAMRDLDAEEVRIPTVRR